MPEIITIIPTAIQILKNRLRLRIFLGLLSGTIGGFSLPIGCNFAYQLFELRDGLAVSLVRFLVLLSVRSLMRHRVHSLGHDGYE